MKPYACSRSLLVAAAIVATFAVTLPAQAQVTITASPSAPSPATSGDGLNASYYGQPDPLSNANADAFIAGNSPVATFISTAVDYPQGGTTTVGDGTSLSTFLGTDAASLSNAGVGTNSLGGQLMQFTGFLNVTNAMDTDTGTAGIQIGLGISSDDGSHVNIGSQEILNNDGQHGFGGLTNTFTFSSPGLYALAVTYWEHGGGTGVEFYSQTGVGGSFGIAPTSMLYRSTIGASAPEPGSFVLLGVSLLPLASIIRRRKA